MLDGDEVMLTRGYTKHGNSVTIFIEVKEKFKFTATYDTLKDIYKPCRYNIKKFRQPKLELYNKFTKNDAEHYLVMFKLNSSGKIRYDL